MPVQEDFNAVVKQHIQFLKDSKTSDKPPQLNNAHHNGNAVLNGNKMANGHGPTAKARNGHIANGHANKDDTTLHDLEGEVETISKRIQGNIANGNNNHVGNGIVNGIGNGIANGIGANGIANRAVNGVNHLANGFGGLANGHAPHGTAIGNGFVNGKLNDLDAQRRDNIRNMYQGIPVDSHI